MNTNFKNALDTLAEVDRLLEKAAAMLNCKPDDCKKVIAAAAYAEGLNVIGGIDKQKQTHLYSVTKPSANKEVVDKDACVEIVKASGKALPMTTRKGNASTLRKA